MSNKVEIIVKESDSELRKLKNNQTTLSKEKRIIALQRIKHCKDETRLSLANYLGVDRKTLRNWLKEYNEGGIEYMLEVRPRRQGSKIITQEIHDGLSDRLNDPKNSFLGYWDAQKWIEKEYGVEVKYHHLRKYLIQYFETKVKRPRKSHIKKDEGAVALF